MVLSEKLFLLFPLGHEASLYLLLVLSVIGLAFALERYSFLNPWLQSSKKVSKKIREALESGRPEWIQKIQIDSEVDPGCRLAASYLKKEPHLIGPVFESFIVSKKEEFSKYLSVLASIGSNAPFIGLLGTIFGVMEAFHQLALASSDDSSAVMAGISKALLAAAAGLGTAIPAILFYNSLRRKIQSILYHLESIKQGWLILSQSKGQSKGQSEERSPSDRQTL